ncbi:MAG: hypothetical protein M1539_03365 [Actinobacteria bacterium]|nr:hypothetical protein [Actinomycetota bacterium]MCL5882997.1 hypothetical protein [Actinomycetota bacterium]
MKFFRNKFTVLVLIFLGYSGMALYSTYPLVLHFGDYFIGGGEDGSLCVWSFWWMKFALVDLNQSLLDCHYLFFPNGVNLTFNVMPKLLGTIGIPLQYFLSLAAAYNLVVILTFVSSGLSAYWLAHRVIGRRLPAFIAGALFAFSPYRMSQTSHLYLMATMLIPVYVVLLMMVRESLAAKRRRRWLYCCLAGVVLALTAYDTEHYAIFLIFFSVVYLLFYLLPRAERADKRKWFALTSAFGLILAVAAALFSPMLLAAKDTSAGDNDMLTVSTGYSSNLSADALSFFIPKGGSDMVATPFRSITDNFSAHAELSYLDLVIMGLACIGAVLYRKVREIRLWVLTTVVFMILALGPTLRAFGKNSQIPMPLLLINQLPYVNAVRAPTRYIVIASLALAILAGFGANAIFDRMRRFRHQGAAVTISAALILIVFLVEITPAASMVLVEPPPVMREIAASEISGTVISLPLGWETASTGKIGRVAAITQLDQIVHMRPTVGGVVARAPKELIYEMARAPIVDYLSDPSSSPSRDDLDPRVIKEAMDKFQIAYIVVHKLYPVEIVGSEVYHTPTHIEPRELKNIDQYVINNLGMEKFEDTEEIVAYRRKG